MKLGPLSAAGDAVSPSMSKTPAGPPYEARLPSGVTVELLGVSENPSRDRPWWRPDGSPLAEPPYDWLEASVEPEPGKISREIVVRLSKLPIDAIACSWQVNPGDGGASGTPSGPEITSRTYAASPCDAGREPDRNRSIRPCRRTMENCCRK